MTKLIQTVITSGDSFIWGSELSDDQGTKTFSLKTFPAIVAADYNYICTAWPGIGNEGIARAIIDKCQSSDRNNIFVFVVWSAPGRYEFRFKYDTKQKNSPWYTFDKWTIADNIDDLRPEFLNQSESIINKQSITLDNAKISGVSEFASSYYKHIGNSEYWEIYTSLKEIVYLQNYLLANNIPYLFSCVDSSIIYNYTIDHADVTISSLYNQIQFDKWFLFPPGELTDRPEGFYQWAINNKYEVGALHPLDEAHKIAAELIKEKFDELVKKHY